MPDLPPLHIWSTWGLIKGVVLQRVTTTFATLERARELSNEVPTSVPDWLLLGDAYDAKSIHLPHDAMVILTSDPRWFINLQEQIHGNAPR